MTQYIHHSTLAPTDYGNGVILDHRQHAGYHGGDYWGASRVALVDCKTNAGILLTRTATDHDGKQVISKSRAVDRILKAGQGKDHKELFDLVERRAKWNRVPYQSFAMKDEVCGCKAFYPELVVGKKPYEVSQ
ncbi:hypothetical protein [Parasulfitobacter algicola]|uniref:Uncharacterized protein n=1 Tax=Parasulfitobacter algicola TaxID=2614809 RepID=A0ABX2IUM0_9RHOB|nr:hypothetical protein [Sulfitobacter algicola]NSX56609.1 hypothetical protein [Sulfitobacter algicola]